MTTSPSTNPFVDVRRPGLAAVHAKGRLRANTWLIARRAAQVFFLALFLSGPLAGIWIAKGTLASSMTFGFLPLTDPMVGMQALLAGHLLASTALIGMAIVVVGYAFIGGRAYCAFVCPVNFVTDLAHWLHRRLGIGKGWQPRRRVRLWMLGMVLMASAITGTVFWEFINPVTILHRELVFGTLWTSGFTLTLIGAIFAFDLFVSRHGWCGHLCPVGAFYGLIGKYRLPAISASGRSKCDHCMVCYAACPEPHVIAPALKEDAVTGPLIQSSDCTLCGRCIDVCPHDVFNLTTRFNNSLSPIKTEAEALANRIAA